MKIPSSNFPNYGNSNTNNPKTVIINGRRMMYDGTVDGSDLVRESHAGPGRRAVIRNGLEVRTIDPTRQYQWHDLQDKHGRPVRIDSMPDRSKGGVSYGQPRSSLSKAVIIDQVVDIAAKCFKNGIEFDEGNADWMVVPRYRLPSLWRHEITPLLIVFPTDYPEIPPVGFYLKADLGESPNGHFFGAAYHDACKTPIENGWKWYCAFYQPGSWRPAAIRTISDWRHGDNLWTHLTLIGEVLGNTGE